MSIKNLIEMIKHNGLLASMAQLEKLYQAAIENEQKLAELEARCAALAAENAGLKAAFDATIGWQQSTDPVNVESVRMLVDIKTPATDAFLAEVRASVIPEGYVLVPQEMHLSSEAMEGICFHCGDGGFAFGEFTDGLLFVGAIDDSDGQKVHGLHIATADYPEEGCATVCAFQPAPSEGDAQLRKGVQS